MKIELNKITLRSLAKGYADNSEGGVIGYEGRLDIRPPYQREFIYKDQQRDAVINTIRNGFPLNVMYWAVRADGNFEVIDGQQRTISACQYINGDFSIDGLAFHNLPKDKQELILDYELNIYFCSGTDSEKLEWFQTINIAGERLTNQELRNAVYSGPWVSDAKRYFSKTGCPAYGIASNYLHGSPIRQDYLETALDWISAGKIQEYMSKHQHDPNANELWLYFQNVINWVQVVFPSYRKEMKGVHFGSLYNRYSSEKIDASLLELEIRKLMIDDEVTKKSGIYEYVLSRNERALNIRSFTANQKREVYELQGGICVAKKAVCGNSHFEIEEMEADHIKPWHEGGKTVVENCQMLCKQDNRIKSGK